MLKSLCIGLFLPVLLLGGCAWQTGRVDPTLGELLPEQYLEAAGESAVPLSGRWWLAFNDPELDQVMERLFAGNLQLEQGFARLDQSRAALRSLRSSSWPDLDLDAQGGRSMEPSFAGDSTGNSLRLSAAASYEVDLWRKLASRSVAGEKALEASRDELQSLYLGLSAQLADLYYLAVEQRAQLQLTERSLASYRETLERVEARYRLGTAPAIDVYQARQSLTAAQASQHLFAANLATAEHAISVLLGDYPKLAEAGELNQLPTLPESFPTGLPTQLVERRPDLRAALRRIEAADSEVAAAIAARFPALNLVASYGTTRQDFATGLIKGEFWSFLGSLSAPVFDAGRRKAEVERTQAVVRERVAAYQQAALTAFREVEDALSTDRETELRITSLEETGAATAATLRLALERYLHGVADYLPVLTAQRADYELQSRLLSARRTLISNRISLARALGGDWMNQELEQRRQALNGER